MIVVLAQVLRTFFSYCAPVIFGNNDSLFTAYADDLVLKIGIDPFPLPLVEEGDEAAHPDSHVFEDLEGLPSQNPTS